MLLLMLLFGGIFDAVWIFCDDMSFGVIGLRSGVGLLLARALRPRADAIPPYA
jgi:hypothetical protein